MEPKYEFVVTDRQADGKFKDKKYSFKTLAGARKKAERVLGTDSLKRDSDGYVSNRHGRCVTPVVPMTVEDLFPSESAEESNQ